MFVTKNAVHAVATFILSLFKSIQVTTFKLSDRKVFKDDAYGTILVVFCHQSIFRHGLQLLVHALFMNSVSMNME